MSEQNGGGLQRPSWVRSAVDFGALVAFLGSFFIQRLRGVPADEAMILATWVLMGASVIALAVGWLVERRLAWLPAIAGGFALVFGVLTVVFHNADFMKIKVSVQNGLLAAALLGSLLIGRNAGKALLGGALPLPDRAWKVLTLRYGLYFAACAIANEAVRLTQSTDFWVAFRGGLQVTAVVFAFANIPYIMKHLKTHEPVAPENPDPM